MPRPLRTIVGDMVYHVLNRSNGRMTIFETIQDYSAFEKIIEEAVKRHPMRILAWNLMPNHWHFVLHPQQDGDLAPFMRWITLTHTQRWHAHKKNVGYGHLYQGRYKSFPIQQDDHFLTVCRYVERNALRAGLVTRATDWRWSSAWRRLHGTAEQKKFLSPWPVPMPSNYETWLETPLAHEQVTISQVRQSVNRGNPYGNELWTEQIADHLDLGSTIRQRGRPKKGT